jgi:tRNA-modifying protein YgfZ
LAKTCAPTHQEASTVSNNPYTALPGAVGDPPLHYGNPLGEQKALATGLAVVDLSDRGVVTVTGPDRLTFLDSLTSQSLKSLRPGESAETLQLDPTGRVEFVLRVIDDGETAWLLTDDAAPVAAWLDRMRFMLRVEVADVTAQYSTVGSLRPVEQGAAVEGAAVEGAAPNGVPLVWVDPWNSVSAGGWQYAERDGYAWGYSETLVPRSAPALPNAAGTLALEALRIAAWRPRGTEIDDRTIPHELDWLRSAVHLSKGCYRGQETVAKVHNLGHPPRRLVMLHLDGSEGVHAAAGDAVTLGETAVGTVTSAGIHYELGPIALAVVKRTTDPLAELAVTAQGVAIAASQEIIVPVGAGAVADIPRIPRLGAVTR